MKRPFFSIIIATYNSENTLEYTLESIANQSIDKSEVETLVIDGGSTDKTLDIAQKYSTIILDNPIRLPEHAKAIGMERANGQFVVRMDSDEEFSYSTQLQDKMDFLKAHPEVKILLPNRYASGRKEICGISGEYMNIFGDPFSLFVYRTKYDKYDTYSANIIETDGKHAIMRFAKEDIYPLADSATTAFSLDFVRENFGSEYTTVEFTCGAVDKIIDATGMCGCIKGDNIIHNCSSSFKTYLSKLRFRVINNLFHKEESGFSARERVSNSLTKRKLLFCIYALFVPVPVADSIRIAIKYKEKSFLLHFIYLYYVCFQIFKLGIVRIFGGTAKNLNYGK